MNPAKLFWNGFTPLGKCTIAVPIAVLLCVMALIILPLPFILHKLGLAARLERLLARVERAFIKKDDHV